MSRARHTLSAKKDDSEVDELKTILRTGIRPPVDPARDAPNGLVNVTRIAGLRPARHCPNGRRPAFDSLVNGR